MNSEFTKANWNSETIDEQLVPYLNSTDRTETQEHLNRLLEKARPIVYRIARSMRVGAGHSALAFNTQDILGDVCVRLLRSLRAFKSDPRQHTISNFSGLVAATTSTVFADLLRGKDRQRRSLYQKVRRLIAANPELAIWKDNAGSAVCGYAVWRSTKESTVSAPAQMKLDFESPAFNYTLKRNTAELILLVLKNAGRPIKFDEFVDLLNIASAALMVARDSLRSVTSSEHSAQSSRCNFTRSLDGFHITNFRDIGIHYLIG